MSDILSVITTLVDRIRVLEANQWGNGFVPYLFQPLFGDNSLTNHGTHTVMPLGLSDIAYIEITMPRKAANLEEAVLMYIPTASSVSATWDGIIDTTGGYCGEDESEHTDHLAFYGESITDDEIECLDISAALTDYQAGDIVGIKITNDALYDSTAINIIGVRLR